MYISGHRCLSHHIGRNLAKKMMEYSVAKSSKFVIMHDTFFKNMVEYENFKTKIVYKK